MRKNNSFHVCVFQLGVSPCTVGVSLPMTFSFYKKQEQARLPVQILYLRSRYQPMMSSVHDEVTSLSGEITGLPSLLVLYNSLSLSLTQASSCNLLFLFVSLWVCGCMVLWVTLAYHQCT